MAPLAPILFLLLLTHTSSDAAPVNLVLPRPLQPSLIFSEGEEGPQEVTVRPGHDVTLQCQGPSDSPITVVKWSRSDLDSNPYIFYFRENRSDEDYQRPSHRGRVELRDPEMKNGDASVILKNVTVSDTGTYECVVSVRRNGNRKRNIDPFSVIKLNVRPVSALRSNSWAHLGGRRRGRRTRRWRKPGFTKL
ncbi:butyrophilin subfamily 1 member A1-like [Dicentrarchus labrax]|uniref:butyrophilin subfamily 1 member A1-like n=1 Tax=Dicentrarchus labrax TaxID=13489 RepID=UPI0021F5EB5D|nr:butyrophilin subfamily 1 member A1-like [Dicentrarchus labrax]